MTDIAELDAVKKKHYLENFLDDIDPLIPYLENPKVTDIRTSQSGEIIVKIFDKGKVFTGQSLSKSKVRSIIVGAATLLEKNVDPVNGVPKLEAVIPPPYNARITGLLPPWVDYPMVWLRLPPKIIYPLESYVEEKRLRQDQYETICAFVKARKNILVGGATGSGKTTFTNAVLKKMAEYTPDDNFYIVEDVPELQLDARDKTMLAVRPKEAAEAVRTALRCDPDRIVFGEIRYGEVANEVLKSWNTGHTGNITTIHADSSSSMILRFQDLLREEIKGAVPDVEATIHLCVHLSATPNGPVVDEVLRTSGAGNVLEYSGHILP
jgi:type IV secretion system protein VirB11